MKRIVFAIVLASFAACTQTSESKPETPPAAVPKLVVLVVTSGGSELGTIRIPAGELGKLTATKAPGAQRLVDEWAKIEKARAVTIPSHETTDDGSRGAYGVRVTTPSDSGFAQSVLVYLKYIRDFEVAEK